MKINQTTIFFIIVIVLVFGGIITFVSTSGKENSSVNYESFVGCIKENGAVFYGASWCIHCNNTKAFFGSAKKSLPYIECSTPDGDQNQVCKDKKIEGYPTWEFKDGSRITGEINSKIPESIKNLYTISEKTSCPLPVGAPLLSK